MIDFVSDGFELYKIITPSSNPPVADSRLLRRILNRGLISKNTNKTHEKSKYISLSK